MPLTTNADGLFHAGRFEAAAEAYAEALKAEPGNFHAYLRLGEIALLANRLEEAERWLTKAVDLGPDEPRPRALLAEVHYRRDDFQAAASLFRALGRDAMARKLESFEGRTPYATEPKAQVASLPLVTVDPLPIVQVQVNGSGPVNFLIDTGGAEVILDAAFADEVGAARFGTERGTFAGGQQAAYEHGRVDSMTLGDVQVRNVPVHLMNVRRFSQILGRPLEGILGTVLLYHFLPTLDYPGGQLVLGPRTAEHREQVAAAAKERNAVQVPFWMAGDHYMVAWGRVNQSPPLLIFVDTGLAGAGFTCPESTLRAAEIGLQEEAARAGLGGGGQVKAVPFVVDTLALGEATEHNVQGLYLGAFPLEEAFGFHIGGLVSHAFFRPYALTLDFDGMSLILERKA